MRRNRYIKKMLSHHGYLNGVMRWYSIASLRKVNKNSIFNTNYIFLFVGANVINAYLLKKYYH